ncbi:NAD(P)/FAD-dependent oxidoreductase [Allosphingosinicella deserti]|uniref:FAD-dependent oxidoreductase n=1 Tax=Allosphingosinicella deserti TaxID=2116704 RepID=A0A2P7QN92_9SPHN|nr:FAD-dependent oxidoreductase [Sphingomonas deserti]PSJ39439.1 FAD-dependent oxidoreductase [Sphingomonas deserti]
MSEIVVIGGGVIGLATAVTLARQGHGVRVIEASPVRNAASWGNAGHIAVEQVSPLAAPATLRTIPKRLFSAGGALALPPSMIRHWLPFGLRMLRASSPRCFEAGRHALAGLLADAMPAWSRLLTAVARPDLLRCDGHIIAWESTRSAAAGRAAWEAAETGSARIDAVQEGDLAMLREMTGGRIADAIQFHGSGQISDLDQLADVLEEALLTAGGEIIRSAAALHVENGRASVKGHAAELVLVAAGVGSRSLMTTAGHYAPLIAERGYHIRASADRWPAQLPPLVLEDRSMIVTRYADCVQAASFVEFGAPDAPADPRKWQRLERHVSEIGLPLRGPFTRWMGARPTLPDYLPAIGRSRRVPNLLYAFGHQHLGLTLAPVTAEIVSALVCGETVPVDLAPFAVERFGRKHQA